LEIGAKTKEEISKRIKIFFQENIWQFKKGCNAIIFNDLRLLL
jgi:hypothetical protein